MPRNVIQAKLPQRGSRQTVPAMQVSGPTTRVDPPRPTPPQPPFIFGRPVQAAAVRQNPQPAPAIQRKPSRPCPPRFTASPPAVQAFGSARPAVVQSGVRPDLRRPGAAASHWPPPCRIEPAHLQRTGVSRVSGKVVQRTKYDADVRIIDTADHDDFGNYAEAMRRVNTERLESVRNKILEKAVTTQNADDLWATKFLNRLLGNLPEWLAYPPVDHSRVDAHLPAEPYIRCGNRFTSFQPGGPMHKTKKFIKFRCVVGPWPDVYCWWPISDAQNFKTNRLGFVPQCEYGESGGGLLNARAKAMYPEDAKAYAHLYS